jgi:Leucine-rich repeat (LRR) protein
VIRFETNQLTSLTINNCQRLTKLNCSRNKITNLTIINSQALKEIDCSLNKITKLKIDGCKNLTNLDNLNLKTLINLERLYCFENQLNEIDLFSLPISLIELNIKNNDLSERDLSGFSHLVNLESLKIGNNK